jgi:predicted ABC-type ATPase
VGPHETFVLTMRHSGLRIGDTIALKRDRMKGNKLFLYTQKTGTAVYVPLPPAVVEALGKLEGDSEYFFSSGRAKPQTARANWSRYLDTVFELAKVKDAHSHRFRDTFPVSLLENGVSLENLSVLLGHSSVRITERHYKPWVKTLQRKLEFAFEITLASRTFAPWLRDLRASGYAVHFFFLWLPSADFAVERVADRVRAGGHNVPEETVRRRYRTGLRNFFRLYEPIASTWRLYDGSGPEPRLVADRLESQPLRVYDEAVWGVVRRQETT